jgi:hypothetical protein
VLESHRDDFDGTWSHASAVAQINGSAGGPFSFDHLGPGHYKFSLMLNRPCSCATPVSSDIVATTAVIAVSEGVDIEVNFTGIVLGTLEIGKLVRSSAPGSTQVYLVNGLKSLLRVNDIAIATDAGLSPTVTAASPAALAPYVVQSAALSSVMVCDGSTWVASAGGLWSVSATLVTGLAKSELHASICWSIHRWPAGIPGGLFLQSSTGPATYYITESGEKRSVSGRLTMSPISYPYSPVVLRVSNSFLNTIPTGLPMPSYFGKRPTAGPMTTMTAPSAEADPHISPLTVDERVACYTRFAETLRVSLFAPMTAALTLSSDCRHELNLAPVPPA